MLLPRLPDGRLAFERQQDRPMATSQGDGSSLEASNPSKNPCRVGVSTVYLCILYIQTHLQKGTSTTKTRGFDKNRHMQANDISQ